MKLCMVIAVFTSIFFTGCASTKPDSTVKVASGSSVDVLFESARTELNDNFYPDLFLREVRPSHSAIQKGIGIVGILFGTFNRNSFNKNALRGEIIKNLTNPTTTWFTPKAQQSISQWLDKNGKGYVYKEKLHVGYATWALIYKGENDAYQLKYKVLFYKYPEDKSTFSRFMEEKCEPTPVEASLDDWHANNYEKVILETEKYMRSCLVELNNQLPILLKQ